MSARRRILAGAFVSLAAFAAYSGTFKNGFTWDDHIYVEGNPFVQAPANLRLLLSARFYAPRRDVLAGSRPVFLASLLVDRALWGERPAGYHLTNALLHSMNSVLAFALACALPAASPLAAGLVFALHPAQSEAVNAVSFRTELLAAFFVFAGLLSLLRARGGGRARFCAWLCASGACFWLGLLAKESAAVLPALAVLAESYFPSGLWSRRRLAAACVVFLLVSGLYAWFRAPRFSYSAIEEVRPEPPPAAQALFRPAEGERSYAFDPSAPAWEDMYKDRGLWFRSMSKVFALYFRIMAWPWPLVVDRAPELVRSWPRLDLLGSWTLLALLAGCAFALRRRHPVQAFGVAWCLAALAPVSGVVPIYNPVAERYLYLPVFGAACVLSWAAAAGKASRAALAAALLLFSGMTYIRSLDWRDDASLFFSVPDELASPRVRYNRGNLRLGQGDRRGAFEEYAAALRLHPGYAEAWMNLGSLYKEAGEYPKARLCYEKAVSLDPR